MRLPLLPPASLSPDQQSLYDDMVDVIEENFGELVARADWPVQRLAALPAVRQARVGV